MNSLEERISSTAAHVFTELGNSVNVANIIRPKVDKYSYTNNQEKALKKDWGAVGREVRLAIGKFNEIHGTK